MIASQVSPASTAPLKTYSLPKKPASGGMPVSENMKIAISTASTGWRCDRPCSRSMDHIVLFAALHGQHHGERTQVMKV